jgi:hypothetical protein
VQLDPGMTASDIEQHLKVQSERVYGHERTQEISGQIEHLSRMLSEILHRELDLTDTPPDTRGISERDER